MKFTEGEQVLAKHPNTSEYYKGRILNIRGDRYKIQFETGTEHMVKENDIKVIASCYLVKKYYHKNYIYLGRICRR